MSPLRISVPATPEGLPDDPIGWFLAEHQRHRQFCALMRLAAVAPHFDEALMTWLLDFVVQELARHIADEEQDFFPMLRARAQPEDDVDLILARLSIEHGKDLDHAQTVQEHLETCLRRRIPASGGASRRRSLQNFADQELRHLALENAVVLPLARLRLTPEDLTALGGKLAARRATRGGVTA